MDKTSVTIDVYPLINEDGSINGDVYIREYSELCRVAVEEGKSNESTVTRAEELHDRIESSITEGEYTAAEVQLAIMGITLTLLNGLSQYGKASKAEEEVLNDADNRK